MATMVGEGGKGADMLGRTSLMLHTDGRGQVQTERGLQSPSPRTGL
jgi:hypothetical protein